MRKRNSERAKKPCQVNWVHHPDPTAEDEFWRLYLKLALEALVEAQHGLAEDKNDPQK